MKKKIAITFPGVPFFRGGAELHVETLQEKLIQRGYNAEIVTIPFKWYPPQHLWEQQLMWKCLDLSETNGEKIDLVIGTKWPSYLAKHDNKIVWLIHQLREAYDQQNLEWSQFRMSGPAYPYLKDFRDADTKAISDAKKIFTISKNVSNRLEKYNGVASEPLYHPPKHYGQYFCEDFGDYIFSVGRLDSMKRLDLLIEAMCYTDKGVRCLIAGTGVIAEEERLKKLVMKYKLEDKIRFLGFITDEEMIRLYAESLAVYFAPMDEDYGYITLEAFLSSKPVVTSVDAGGVLEFAEKGISAMVEKPEAEAIGKAINALYHNKKMAREFGINGYEKVKDISWDNALDKLLVAGGLE